MGSQSSIQWLFRESPLTKLKEVIIFGAGASGRIVKKYLDEHDIKVLFFCDNDAKKHRHKIDGIAVYDPILLAQYKTLPIIIASTALPDIYKQLASMGFCENLYCGLKDSPGPYPSVDEIADKTVDPNNYSVLFVLPSKQYSDIFIQKGFSWFKQRFSTARTYCVASVVCQIHKFCLLLPDQNILPYEKTKNEDYDVIVFMQNEDSSFADDEINSIIEPYVFMLTLDGTIVCINRDTTGGHSTLSYPTLNDHIFSQLGSANPHEHYYFFPFAVLHRDTSMGPINALGFRITEDLKVLEQRDTNHKIIGVFGGSTVFSIGCLHEETWTYQLEKKLNDFCFEHDINTKFTVLNFGQPGCVVVNELLFYLFFCQSLHLDYVIAHDGYHDLDWGQVVDPSLLSEHQISYIKDLEAWPGRLHNHNKTAPNRGIVNSSDVVLQTYFERKCQFKNIVESFGSVFLWGIQPILHSKKPLTSVEKIYHQHGMNDTATKNITVMYENLHQLPYQEKTHIVKVNEHFAALNTNKTLFIDFWHTNADGDDVIADTYCSYFTKNIMI